MSLSELNLPPLRRLDDFILGSARFQLPNYNDMDRWGNRVVNNALYYQTNYFVLMLLVFLCVGFLHPGKILLGACSLSAAFAVYCYITKSRSALEFQKKYPWVGAGATILGGYFIVYLLDSIMVFMFGILLPISLTFIHASLRLRNVKNKLSNKIMIFGLRRSPMGKILELLEMKVQLPGNHGTGETYNKSCTQ